MNPETVFNNSSLKIFTHSNDIDQFFKDPKPNQCVYFARYGKSFDGHVFALKIIRSKNWIVGEINCIKKCFQNAEEQNEILNSSFFIPSENVEQDLKDTCKDFYLKLNYTIKSVGVTGTSGKTSIVQIAGQVFNKLNHEKTLKIGTLGLEFGYAVFPNSHQTTPDYPAFVSALRRAKDLGLTHLLMEVSSHGLSENRLYDYKFDIAVFSNFSNDHLDFHKSMDDYFHAKTLLFSKHLKETGACIISAQSHKWIEVIASAAHSKRTLYLLVNEQNLDCCLKAQPFVSHFKNAYFLILSNQKSTFSGLSGVFKLLDSQQNLIGEYSFAVPLIGDMNFENMMATFCMCHACEFSPEQFVPLFSDIIGVPGRMQIVSFAAQPASVCAPYVIVDYSHKPGALEAALKTLRNLLFPPQRLISVFGCGGDRDQSKRPLMGEISARLSDITILTSDNPRSEDPQKIINDIRAGIPKESCCYEEADRYRAIEKAFQIARQSDIILIAGRGNETKQIIGTQKKEFSDVTVAASFFQQDCR